MRCLFVAVLLATSGPTAAEWVRLGESGELTYYVDPATIVRMDSTVKMVTLHDHKTPRTTVRGWIYRSEKIQGEFDCQRERWRTLYSTFHLSQMARGPVSGDARHGAWTPVASESVAQAALKFACDKN